MSTSMGITTSAESEFARMDGKTVVLTGATSGIGRATAIALGRLGANLLLLSRNRSAADSLVRRIAGMDSSARAEFIEVDLSSLAQVRDAANQVRTRWSSIDVLINNAGARFDSYARTAEGNERTFATNHLGHFLLTNLLQNNLTAAPAARILTVSSSAAAQATNDGRWQYGAADYDRKQAYAKSKLANLLFAFELARRLEGTPVTSMAVDPGAVATRFARNNGLRPWLKHLLYHGRRRELLSSAQGADTLVHFAATPSLPPQAAGGYFRCRQKITACPAACDTTNAINLWNLSASLCEIECSIASGANALPLN